MRRLSILIPAYQEERTIAEVLRRVASVDTTACGFDKEIIVVDDGSRDGTAAEVDRVAPALGVVTLVRHDKNRGKGAAIRTALEHATGTQEAAASFGITLLDVRIMRVDLPTEVQASVFARMQAERDRIAKRYRAEGEEQALEIRAAAEKEREIILATAYAQSQVLRGEGDAQAALVTAKAFGQDLEFYGLVRRLQVYEAILGEGSTIILPPDSDLLRYLESPTFVAPAE